MKRYVLRKLRFTTLILLVFCLTGCVSSKIMGSRFYSGSPLPRNDVFLVITNGHCDLKSVKDNKEQDSKNIARGSWVLELLPGQYDLTISYYDMIIREYGSPVGIALNGRGGHVYIIYPEVTEHSSIDKTWRPVVVDVAREEDFSHQQFQCELCASGNDLRKIVNEYFQGSLRRHMGRPIKVFNGSTWE